MDSPEKQIKQNEIPRPCASWIQDPSTKEDKPCPELAVPGRAYCESHLAWLMEALPTGKNSRLSYIE